MTGTVVRRALQVAGLAAGIVIFAGGVAHADSWTSANQDATNVCGNDLGHGGINFNATGCGAGNVAVQDDAGFIAQTDDWSNSANQDAINVCGNSAGNGGINSTGAGCLSGNVAVQDD